MKSYIKFVVLAMGLGIFAPGAVMAQNEGANSAPVTQGETPITITVGDTVMTGRLNSTVMARHLADRLPMTVDFGNHSISGDDFPTKVHRIEPPLPTEGTVLGGRPGAGEIAHYVTNGNLGFYYGQLASHWPGVVSLGTFDGDPKVFERQTGPFEVTIERAAADKRVKAVATTSMYDMSRVMARGYYDSLTDEQRAEALAQMSGQRWTDAENGTPVTAGGLPDSLDGIDDPVIRMYHAYYKTERGYHPRSVNSNGGWTVTNPLSFMNMPLLTYIAEISPRPMLVIAGSEAHSRYFTEEAYAAAAEPKELMIIDGADHVDLYDKMDVIPFERLAEFFGEHLAA